MTDKEMLSLINQYLIDNNIEIYNSFIYKDQNKINMSDCIQAMIYSLLSAVNEWKKIEKNLIKIDELFFQYSKEKILDMEWTYFYYGIKELGIATVSTRKQMMSFHKNIQTLEKIEKHYVPIDNFIKSREPIYIAGMLSYDLEYKLDLLGLPLAC